MDAKTGVEKRRAGISALLRCGRGGGVPLAVGGVVVETRMCVGSEWRVRVKPRLVFLVSRLSG